VTGYRRHDVDCEFVVDAQRIPFVVGEDIGLLLESSSRLIRKLTQRHDPTM